MRHSGSMGNETKINKEDLYRLYVIELKTLKEIGKIYKVSASTIKNFMNKYDLGWYTREYRPKLCIRGDNHPTKRPEVRKILSENHADFSGDKNPNYGATWMIGKGNPNWLGGLESQGYAYEFNEILKREIRKRDNYECQNCGMTEEEHLKEYNEKLHIHHIDYDKMNINKDNLLTLCLKCNIKANYNRDSWTKYFTKGIKCLN